MKKTRIGIAKLPYSGTFGRPENDEGPRVMEEGGLLRHLDDWGCELVENKEAKLTARALDAHTART